MNAPSARRVRDEVLELLSPGLQEKGLRPADVPDHFDLLAEGVVDSFGFLELISSLEASLGVELDFESANPDELTVLGAFARNVEAQAREQLAARAATKKSHRPLRGRPVKGDAISQPASTAPRPPIDRRAGSARRRIGRAAVALHAFWIRARDKAFSMTVGGGFHSFGRNSVIQLPTRYLNPHRITVGDGVFIGSGAWLHVLDSDGEVALQIGDHASIAEGCVLSVARSIRLGTKVSFARQVYVADHSHAYDDPNLPALEQGITDIREVEIGDGAWLGSNVTVLPGVRIGKGAVVAANSVVSKDVPDFSVAAGAPARVVRRFGPPVSTLMALRFFPVLG